MNGRNGEHMFGKLVLFIIGAFLLVGLIGIVIAFIRGGGLYTREGMFWALFFAFLGALCLGYLLGSSKKSN